MLTVLDSGEMRGLLEAIAEKYGTDATDRGRHRHDRARDEASDEAGQCAVHAGDHDDGAR